MKLSVYNDIVESFRSLGWKDFAIQTVSQKYQQYVYIHRLEVELQMNGLRSFPGRINLLRLKIQPRKLWKFAKVVENQKSMFWSDF